MKYEKTYRYWLFYLKPEYWDSISVYGYPRLYPYLFAYTDTKKYAKGFFKIHNPKMFNVKRVDISREEVNELASRFQNGIIREEKMSGKNDKCERVEVILYVSEKEMNIVENQCYSRLDSLWKYMWDIEPGILKPRYQHALSILRYTYYKRRLDDGSTEIMSGIEADILTCFIDIFKPILEV